MNFLRGKRVFFGLKAVKILRIRTPLPNSGRFLGVNKDPPPNSESGKTSVNKDPLVGPPQAKILMVLEAVYTINYANFIPIKQYKIV